MRKYSLLLLSGLVLLSTSCKKYLDVNSPNPNEVTTSSASPELILPAAMSNTASLNVTFSNYGSAIGGGYANAGGFSGFNAGFMSYNYATSDNTGLWSGSFDNISDYQFVLDNTTTTGDYKNFNAIARTLKAYAYLRLVDVYGDLPYTQALKGATFPTPVYDKAEDIYKACITELNTALTSFKAANTGGTKPLNSPNGPIDIYRLSITTSAATSGLDMSKWIQFANTIKLRALLRISKVGSLTSTFTTEMGALGTDPNAFITADVLAQPGYFYQAGKANPTFTSWGWTTAGAITATSSVPTTYAVAFYSGQKLSDPSRGPITYRNYVDNNQLGNQVNAKAPPTNGIFYTGTTTGASATGLGPVKGFKQAQPIMLAAEAYLMIAEANTLGFIGGAGSAGTNFDKGVLASINYLDLNEDGVLGAGRAPATELAAYKAANPASYLVNYNLATTPAQQLEAIITQKWIALNMITANESWSDYKRTTYPKTVPNGGPAFDMASVQSTSSRVDKLPGRILYPASEFSYNAANTKIIKPFTDLIFFDIGVTNPANGVR